MAPQVVAREPKKFMELFSVKLAKARRLLTGDRPWTLDRLYAIISVIALGTTTWIIVGTTTAMSSIIVLANTLQFQEYLVDKIGRILTKHTGITISFEHAEVASWTDSAIRLKNVSIERDVPDYTRISLTAEHIDVKLSVDRYLKGSGIVEELTIRGMHGEVDSRVAYWDPAVEYLKPKWGFGDFDLSKLHMEDVVVEVYQQEPNRPLHLCLYQLECDRFRRQWILYDICTAKYIHGSFDRCLFNVQRVKNHTDVRDARKLSKSGGETADVDFTIENRMKLDGLNIDLLTAGSTGPLSWLSSGSVDIELVGKFPVRHKLFSSSVQPDVHEDEEISLDFDLHLNNLTAKVPINPEDISYMTNALIRPVVAYMNTNYTSIPFQFPVSMRLSDFDGSWYPMDTKIWTYVSDAVGREMLERVEEQKKPRRLREILFLGADGVLRGISFIAYQALEYYV